MKSFLCVILAGILLFAGSFSAFADDDAKALAEAAQNPIASMISVPLQNNFNFGYGPEDDKFGYNLNIQPVIPFKLGEDWNLITRTIVPLTYMPKITQGQYDVFGLGDINESVFLSPVKSGPFGIIWGVGPTFTVPSATNARLGSQKFSMGPAFVGLKIDGPWVYGALIQNQWSLAGDYGRKDVNAMLINPFINYNLPNGWYLSTAPNILADWEAKDDDDIWTVPIGGGIGKILKIGGQPINASLRGYYNVVRPEAGPDWSIQFQVQLMFPQGGK